MLVEIGEFQAPWYMRHEEFSIKLIDDLLEAQRMFERDEASTGMLSKFNLEERQARMISYEKAVDVDPLTVFHWPPICQFFLECEHVLCSTLTVTEDLLVGFPRFIQVVQMNKEFRQEKRINQLVNSRVKNPIIPNVPLCTAPDEQQTVWTCKDCQAVAFFKKDFAKVLTDNVQKISNIVYLGLATVEDFPRWCEELLADCLITVETSDSSEELIKAHCEKFPPFLKQHGGEPI